MNYSQKSFDYETNHFRQKQHNVSSSSLVRVLLELRAVLAATKCQILHLVTSTPYYYTICSYKTLLDFPPDPVVLLPTPAGDSLDLLCMRGLNTSLKLLAT